MYENITMVTIICVYEIWNVVWGETEQAMHAEQHCVTLKEHARVCHFLLSVSNPWHI